eukprot:1616984-Pyramimonas_sp.AAC.1
MRWGPTSPTRTGRRPGSSTQESGGTRTAAAVGPREAPCGTVCSSAPCWSPSGATECPHG